MSYTIKRCAMVALSIVGSATLLFSCDSKPAATVYDTETLMTESSENRTITMMENGARSYTFTAPLIEGYSLAKNPYKEFRRGVKMTTYTSDSLSLVDVILTANYAIFYEKQELWEAKGNVVVIKHSRKDGDTTVTDLTEVYTQQLFWNAKTKKIYSNVDTKILQADALHIGVGFEADDDLSNIHFRKYSSEVEFEMNEEARANRSREREEAEQKAEQKVEQESSTASSQDNTPSKGSANTSTATKNGVNVQAKGAKQPTMSSDADIKRPTNISASRRMESQRNVPPSLSSDARNATLSGEKSLVATPKGNESLSGAQLSGAQLSGAQLSGAQLSGAQLSGASARNSLPPSAASGKSSDPQK